MPSCSDFEVEIEMKLRGALDPARVVVLEAHLSECASCRAYQTLARTTEETMETQTQFFDLPSLDHKIFRLHQQFRLRRWAPLVVMGALAIVLSIVTRQPLVVGSSFAGWGVILFGIFSIRLAMEASEISRLTRTQADFLRFYTGLVRRRIRRIHILSIVVPIAVADVIMLRWLKIGIPSLNTNLVTAILAIPISVGGGRVIWMRVKELPRLRRELRNLERR